MWFSGTSQSQPAANGIWELRHFHYSLSAWWIRSDSLLTSTGCFSSLLLDPDTEVCLHVLRLLQSVLLEPEVLARSGAEVRETLPFQRIVALSQSRNAELQALAKELLEDLKIFEYEA